MPDVVGQSVASEACSDIYARPAWNFIKCDEPQLYYLVLNTYTTRHQLRRLPRHAQPPTASTIMREPMGSTIRATTPMESATQEVEISQFLALASIHSMSRLIS